MNNNVRNEAEPLVDEAELLEINPSYAHVRLKDGRETTALIRDLSPRSVRDPSPQRVRVPSPRHNDRHPDDTCVSNDENKEDVISAENSSADKEIQSPIRNDGHNSIALTSDKTNATGVPLPSSTRVRKPVDIYLRSSHIIKMCYCMCRI